MSESASSADSLAKYPWLQASIEARRGKPLTPEHRAKVSAAAKRRYEDPAERERLAERARGKTATPETRAKMSAYHKGKPKSDAHRFNQSMSRLGISGAVMASIHEDIAALAVKHDVPIETIIRIARGRALVTAVVPQETAPPMPAMRQAVTTERGCLGCGKQFTRSASRRFQCEPCSRRSDA